MDIQLAHVTWHDAEHATTQRETALQIPYDEAPFQALLEPGQNVRLYGKIEIQNDLEEACHVSVRFDLRGGGFMLTIQGSTSPVLFQTRVSMGSQHALKIVNGVWELLSRNALS